MVGERDGAGSSYLFLSLRHPCPLSYGIGRGGVGGAHDVRGARLHELVLRGRGCADAGEVVSGKNRHTPVRVERQALLHTAGEQSNTTWDTPVTPHYARR